MNHGSDDVRTAIDAVVDPDAGAASAPVPVDAPDRRFGGVARLYGDGALARLRGAHVAVLGLGGVGSWVVEALARSGVGHLTLVDLDHVSESNINRQSHALESTVGAAKAAVMAGRVVDIDPRCVVTSIEDFVDAHNVSTLLAGGRFDYVVDAIDDVRAKIAVIAHCRATGTSLVTVGGAGGRTDPSRVRVVDLADTRHEPMLAKIRKVLRARHGFPADGAEPFGIAAVFYDHPQPSDDSTGAGRPHGTTGLNCAGFGSVVSVTAVFGFVAAGLVVDRLARGAGGGPGR